MYRPRPFSTGEPYHGSSTAPAAYPFHREDAFRPSASEQVSSQTAGATFVDLPVMKHATPQALSAVSALLAELRELEPLTERTPGSFYLKSKAFLHFHEDPSGLYADVKLDLASFTRLRVTTRQEQAALLAQTRDALRVLSAGKSKVGHRLSKAWHDAHRMPVRPSSQQRIEWHLAHAKECACRPIPAGVIALMQARGLQAPDPPVERTSSGTPAVRSPVQR
jgi:hypothetical protein